MQLRRKTELREDLPAEFHRVRVKASMHPSDCPLPMPAFPAFANKITEELKHIKMPFSPFVSFCIAD